MLYPLTFDPIFKERIWGGRNLERLYGKPLPSHAPIGESWEITDRPEGVSVINNGPLAGKTLRWLMENQGEELLGRAASLHGKFPLLVKILDAEEKLSLQVHPPAHLAESMRGEAKTEMWYVADARPGAELFVGLRAGTTRAEFEKRVRDGSVAECFHRVPVRTGDSMFLPSGRVHAIGGSVVIFEIQQNSDTTYRVFDWNRVDAGGRPRELHVEQSLQCIDFNDFEPALCQTRADAQGRKRLVSDPLFNVEMRTIEGSSQIGADGACVVVACVTGRVLIGSGAEQLTLDPGGFCLLPASLGMTNIHAEKGAELLVAQPGT